MTHRSYNEPSGKSKLSVTVMVATIALISTPFVLIDKIIGKGHDEADQARGKLEELQTKRYNPSDNNKIIVKPLPQIHQIMEAVEKLSASAEKHKEDARKNFSNKDFSGLLQATTQWINLNPHNKEAQELRAIALLELGMTSACISQCDHILRSDASASKAYEIRSRAKNALGDLEGAATDLEMAQRQRK